MLFQEEFPQLAAGRDSYLSLPKENDDAQYGPGPSLRPQSMHVMCMMQLGCSWREYHIMKVVKASLWKLMLHKLDQL